MSTSHLGPTRPPRSAPGDGREPRGGRGPSARAPAGQGCRAEPLQQALLRQEADEEPEPPRAEPGLVTGPEVTGLGELSKAERRVIALAAVGHTNREIAGKLFITVSTVEQHLTRAYRKLKVSSRADLVATMSQQSA